MRRLWLALSLAACSDPYDGIAADPCSPGHHRVGKSACVLFESAELAVDGAIADWAAIPVRTIDERTSVQLATRETPEGTLLHGFVKSAGPVTITFPTSDQLRWTDRIAYVRGGIELHPVAPLEVKGTAVPGGFEWQVPIALLTAGSTTLAIDGREPFTVCWSAELGSDPCR